ncbi:MAG TPA: choice-of-anchor L domain-containing protein [bacterium]|nr:choice-of-anchor L domain-containing protein [bacterium]
MQARRLFFAMVVIALAVFSCSSPEEDDPGTDDLGGADTAGNADDIQNPDETGDDGATDALESDGDQLQTEELPDVESLIQCEPGKTDECYHGPSGTRDRGICKAGLATCGASGYWGPCEGEVLPQPEICHNDIDENCDGEDGTEDNTDDYDGDGYTYCTGDCCEFTSECTNPTLVNPGAYDFPDNQIDDNCNDQVDEVVSCDTGLAEDSTDPVEMARSIGICPPEEGKDYGLVTAEMLFPDGTTTSQAAQVPGADSQGNAITVDCTPGPPNPDSYAILPKFGSVLVPHEGERFFMMSSGIADDPIPPAAMSDQNISTETMCTRSNAPTDWYAANGSKFPSSPSCGAAGDPGKEPLNDPVMLQVKVKVPLNARSFSVDIYFSSREFPEYVCEYNDFFVALLDSTYTSSDPNLQNPTDKNLAMDEAGNPVGINLAPAGLFRVCCQGGALQCGYDPLHNYAQFCTLGPDELTGTGLYDGDDKNGATGWLVTKGNVVPGEEITLRFAIWDALDHVLDSEVILDNFRWYPVEVKPGTSIQQ